MILFSLLCLLFSFDFQQNVNQNQDFDLEVKVAGLQSGKGQVRVCLFDSEDTFFNKAMACEIAETPQNDQIMSLRFSQKLQEGTYAIVVYQDLNKNGILDRNRLGLPTEPYGFSNNPSTLFGPPSFQKAAFEVSADHFIIIKL